MAGQQIFPGRKQLNCVPFRDIVSLENKKERIGEVMREFCDLHVHSVFSDGTWTPEQLIREAERRDLGAVALCDHNTIAGLPDFLEAARGSTVQAVPGIEFSTEYRGGELHILALFVEPEHYEAVTGYVQQMQLRKEESNLSLVAALKQAGMEVDYAAVKAATPNGQVNRALIAAEMMRRGYCESVQEAFRRWLSPEHGYFVPPKRLDTLETIRFIHSIGAVSVLAHPFLNLSEEELRCFLAEAEGLDGMETEYVSFTPEQRQLAGEIAAEYGLLCSGGSDFHGENKPDIALGTGKGDLAVPISCLRQLEARTFRKN